MTVRPLTDALLKLLNDKQLRLQMGQKGLTTAQKYNWEGISTRLLAYYGKTIEKVNHNGAMR
jgi:glycosyltransferase involved in cell wall biosynthesis